MANGFLQIQMDDASHRPDRTSHARDFQFGKSFMSSKAGVGLAALRLDSQTKIQSSSEDWSLLLMARF